MRNKIRNKAPILFPTDRDDVLDPPAPLRQLQQKEPLRRLVFPDGHVGWLVTSYELARTVLTDPRFSVLPTRRPFGDPHKLEAFVETGAGNLLMNDRPEHTRLRRMLAGKFSPRIIDNHRSAIEQIVNTQIDVLLGHKTPVDLVELFARAVPSMTLCYLLGVPVTERSRFEEPTSIELDPESSVDEVVAARQRLMEYVKHVIDRKRREPEDDLLSELAQNTDLTDEKLATMAIQLFRAGHETTATMFGLGAFCLLVDRNRWTALERDNSIVDGVVEELLRYLTILHIAPMSRTASEDLTLAGTTIKSGESVAISLAAANRDPERFPDPDIVDFGRDARGHLSFGGGIHMCLGQHLARLELQVGFLRLIQRLPKLRLARPMEDILFHRGDRIPFGVENLPVVW